LEGGQNLPKNQLVLEIVSHYAAEHPLITLGELKETFPDSLQGSHGVVAPLDEATPENFKGHKRFFDNSPIKLAGGFIAVCNQWHSGNIEKFIAVAEKLEYKITAN